MDEFKTVRTASSLKEYADAKLERTALGKFVCPSCGSGTGKSKSPAFSIYGKDGDKWKCFSCNRGGDVFDLAGIVLGTSDKREQLEEVADFFRVPIEDSRQEAKVSASKPTAQSLETDKQTRERLYIERCRGNLRNYPKAERYLSSRGFSLEEAERLGIGYDPEPEHGAKTEDGEWINSGRLILPWRGSNYYHIDRIVTDRAREGKYNKPKAADVGEQPLYNPRALDHDSFFLVEGALDALAVELLGHEAMAAGGADPSRICEAAIAKGYSGTVILFLDPDEAGTKGTAKAHDMLSAAGISFLEADRSEFGFKDAAEALAYSREALRAFLSRETTRAAAMAAETQEEAYRGILSRLRVLEPQRVVEDIFTLEDEPEVIPTGFDELDSYLGGGLTRGLYILGAVSSLGKTTLAVQMADQIAASGHTALFVTIEQSAQEIASKSLSRYLSGLGRTTSTQELLSSRGRERWSQSAYADFLTACNRYSKEIAPNLKILEGVEQPSVSDIRTAAQTMRRHDGAAPVIFIDYLQLLAPQDERDSDKQTTDKNVMSLRQLARDLKTPVFCISSLNRSSYSGVISLDSFKESGSIEYGADVLLGLQPKGIAEAVDNARDNKAKRAADKAIRENKSKLERECELVILKQRNGRTPEEGLPLTFKPLSSLFTEGVREVSIPRL